MTYKTISVNDCEVTLIDFNFHTPVEKMLSESDLRHKTYSITEIYERSIAQGTITSPRNVQSLSSAYDGGPALFHALTVEELSDRAEEIFICQ